MKTDFKFYINKKTYYARIKRDCEDNYYLSFDTVDNNFLFDFLGLDVSKVLKELSIQRTRKGGDWPYTTLENCYRIIQYLTDYLPWEPKFKVGDKVRIKPRKEGEYQFSFTDSMADLAGKEYTIAQVSRAKVYQKYDYPATDGTLYTLDGEEHNWSIEMLEEVKTIGIIPKYPYIVGEITLGSNIYFHLGPEDIVEGRIHANGEFVLLKHHNRPLADTIFKAFNEPIDSDRFGVWPVREDTLSMLQRWKDQNPYPITPIEEPTQSLTKNNNQHAVFKLQDQRADFTRREISGGSRLCCRITKATISVKPISYSEISYRRRK